MKNNELTIKLENINLSDAAKSRIIEGMKELVAREFSSHEASFDTDEPIYCATIIPHRWHGIIYRPLIDLAQAANLTNEEEQLQSILVNKAG